MAGGGRTKSTADQSGKAGKGAHMSETKETHVHIMEDGSVVEHSHGAHGHHHSHAQTKAVLNRLSRAIGHMESIKRMVEDGRDCSEVLIQLSAVKSAINNTGKIILQDHIEHCIVDAVEHGGPGRYQGTGKGHRPVHQIRENLTAQIDDNNIEGEVRWQRNVTAKPVTNQAARDAAAKVRTWILWQKPIPCPM